MIGTFAVRERADTWSLRRNARTRIFPVHKADFYYFCSSEMADGERKNIWELLGEIETAPSSENHSQQQSTTTRSESLDKPARPLEGQENSDHHFTRVAKMHDGSGDSHAAQDEDRAAPGRTAIAARGDSVTSSPPATTADHSATSCKTSPAKHINSQRKKQINDQGEMYLHTAFDPALRMPAKPTGAPLATSTSSRNIFEATEGFFRSFRTHPQATHRMHSYADSAAPAIAHGRMLNNLSCPRRNNGDLSETVEVPYCSRSSPRTGESKHTNVCVAQNGVKSVSSFASPHSCERTSGDGHTGALHNPPAVQRVHTPPPKSDPKSQVHTIPKLRFKGAMFSGNITTENSSGKDSKGSCGSHCEQPLDLSKVEDDKLPRTVNQVKTPQKRDHPAPVKDDAPLDLTVKRPKRDCDDDVVFVGVQPAPPPLRNQAVLSPSYVAYQQNGLSHHKDWRPVLQMRLKEKQDKVGTTACHHQGRVNVAHGVPGMAGDQRQHLHAQPRSPLSAGATAYSPTIIGNPMTPPQYIPPSSHVYGSPNRCIDQKSIKSARSMQAGVRQTVVSEQASPGQRSRGMSAYPQGSYAGYHALPAQGMLNDHQRHVQVSQGYAYTQQMSPQAYKHPSQIPATQTHTCNYTGGIPPVASMSKQRSASYYVKPSVPSPAHQKVNPLNAFQRPTGFEMPGANKRSTAGASSRTDVRYPSGSEWNSAPPVAHTRKHNGPVSQHPLHIDIPSTVSAPENRNKMVSSSATLEHIMRIGTNSRVLPKAHNCRSIMTGTVGPGRLLGPPKRRGSESSPPELSVVSPLPGSTRMTCPSPLPSPQMPILSPQKTVPPDGSPFASPLPRQSSSRSQPVVVSDPHKLHSRSPKINQSMTDSQRRQFIRPAGMDDKFRIHRGNPEVSRPERVPSPIPASDLYPPPLTLASCVQRTENTASFVKSVGEEGADLQTQGSVNPEQRKQNQNKVVSPTLVASQMVSMVNCQGAEVASMIAKAGSEDVAKSSMGTLPGSQVSTAGTAVPPPSASNSCEGSRGNQEESIQKVEERVNVADCNSDETKVNVPSAENLAVFLPTSEKYSSEPLVISNSMAPVTSSEPIVTVANLLTTQASLENFTRTKSVTSTTCSTRVVPVANVNPMIQGRLATSQARTPPATSSSPMFAIPACGYMKDWMSSSDIAKFKMHSLRMPAKLVNVPPTTPARNPDTANQESAAASCSAGVFTTTVTTRPTPVSLPSRSAPENVHVTTQPVTPIKRGPHEHADGPRFPHACISSTGSIQPSTISNMAESSEASPTPADTGFIQQDFKRRRKRKREDRDDDLEKSTTTSNLLTDDAGRGASVLEEVLNSKSVTNLDMTSSKLSVDSSATYTVARCDRRNDGKETAIHKGKLSEPFSAEKKVQSSTVKKMTKDAERPKARSRAKKQSPLMRKVSRQVAQELEKHVQRRRKAKELQSQMSECPANEEKEKNSEKPIQARNNMAERKSPTAQGDNGSPHSKNKTKSKALKPKSKTPSPEVKKVSPKKCQSPRLSPNMALRLLEQVRQDLRSKRLSALRKLELDDTESDSALSQDVCTDDEGDSSFRLEKRQGKRRMLASLRNSDGFVADRQHKTCGDLFADPSKLSREERALQRAMLRFTEMERREKTRGVVRRQTAAVTKAKQLKRKAVRTSLTSPVKNGKRLSPLSPKQQTLLHTRTRSQEAAVRGCRRVLSYHKNDRYEQALLDDELRKCFRQKFPRRSPILSSRRRSRSQPIPAKESDSSPENPVSCKDEDSPLSSTPTAVVTCESVEISPVSADISPESQEVKYYTQQSAIKEETVAVSSDLEMLDQEWQMATPPKKRKRRTHWRRKRDGFPKPKYRRSGGKRGGRGGRGRGRRGRPDRRADLLGWQGMGQLGSEYKILPAEVMELPIADTAGVMFGIEGVSEDFPIHPDDIKLEPLDDGYDTGFQSTPPGGTAPGRALPPMLKKLSVYRDTGETVLHRAARLGYEDVAFYCAETKYVDVNARDNAGFTPLHESCVNGHVTIAKALLAFGANVNVSSKVDGIRPIHDAVENDNVEMVRLLLSCGADPNLATYSGRTALKLARSDTMKNFLRGYLADLRGEDEDDDSQWNFLTLRPGQGTKTISGFNVFADVPSDPEEDQAEDDVLFDLSDRPHAPTYLMKLNDDQWPTNYLLLPDVLKELNMSRDEFINIHGNVKFASITWQDFVQQTAQQQLPVHCQLLPPEDGDRSSYVEVLQLDAHLRAILGVQTETRAVSPPKTSRVSSDHTGASPWQERHGAVSEDKIDAASDLPTNIGKSVKGVDSALADTANKLVSKQSVAARSCTYKATSDSSDGAALTSKADCRPVGQPLYNSSIDSDLCKRSTVKLGGVTLGETTVRASASGADDTKPSRTFGRPNDISVSDHPGAFSPSHDLHIADYFPLKVGSTPEECILPALGKKTLSKQ